jgi:hypothetical protein
LLDFDLDKIIALHPIKLDSCSFGSMYSQESYEGKLRLIDMDGDLNRQHRKYNLKSEYDYKCVVNVKKK